MATLPVEVSFTKLELFAPAETAGEWPVRDKDEMPNVFYIIGVIVVIVVVLKVLGLF